MVVWDLEKYPKLSAPGRDVCRLNFGGLCFRIVGSRNERAPEVADEGADASCFKEKDDACIGDVAMGMPEAECAKGDSADFAYAFRYVFRTVGEMAERVSNRILAPWPKDRDWLVCRESFGRISRLGVTIGKL